MKKLILIFTVALAACGQQSGPTDAATAPADRTQVEEPAKEVFFGDKIDPAGAIPIAELKSQMSDKKEMAVKVIAPIQAVCQKKGCWMDLSAADGSVRVTFKDYSFFVPKDAAGKEAVVEGIAKVEETSVQDLKEYAKDAGKSKEEIEAITEPKQELVLEASGVMIR
jgi:predicted small lipoprotein YifL